MTHPTPNITTLLAATADLECGHPVEAVLKRFNMHDRFRIDTAYEAARQYQLALQRAETASTQAWSAYHTKRAKTLLPCVLAIAEALGISTHA